MREYEQPQYNKIESSRRRVEQGFPESKDERLSALLSSFNSGSKAVTQVLLSYNGYISPSDLTRSFFEVFKGTEVANVYKNTPPVYCLKTLCPIGLVAREYTIEYFGMEKLVGFGRTEAGKAVVRDFLIPLVGLAQDDNRTRLISILSNSHKGLTVLELFELMGLHDITIRTYLKSLTDVIQREKRKGVYYYNMKPTE